MIARTDLQVVPVALATAAVFVLFAVKDGGFAATVWLPAGVFFVLMLALTLAFVATGLRRLELLAVLALSLFAAWSGLSILWAGTRGDAWDGANRTLLYLCVFCLFVVLPWRAQSAVFFMTIFCVGVTTVVLVEFLRVAAAPAAHHGFFISGRLAAPISYSNADCALLLMAAFPSVVLSSRRELPVIARGLLLATAGIAFELAIACQSRMSLIAAPLTVLFVFVVAGRRMRLLVVALPVTAAVVLASGRMLDIYDVVLIGPAGHALAEARTALIVSALVLFTIGCAVAAVDRRTEPAAGLVRACATFALVVVFLLAVAGSVALASAFPHPLRTLDHRWTSFSHGSGYTDRRKLHLTSGGTNRYDIWRVALNEFASAPALGVGADNFAVDYLRQRRSSETPLYPHSLDLRVLSQTGVVGVFLFASFLGAAVVAALRGLRSPESVVTAGAAVFVYWFVHGAADWLWEIPALGAPAFACLAIAVRLSAGERVYGPTRLPAPLIAVVAAALIASFGFPWIAAQETAVAGSTWPANRRAAFGRLDLAARLNPLSDVPFETKGLIAARSGDPLEARNAFAQALDRSPANWFTYLELGVMQAQLHQHAAALASVERAAALNPRERAIDSVRRRILSRLSVSQEVIDDLLAPSAPATGLGR